MTPPDVTVGPAGSGPATRQPDLSAFDASPTGAQPAAGQPTFASAVGAVDYDDGTDWAERENADKNATYALILGIASLMCGVFLGIPALILGVKAIPKASTSGRVRAIIGIVLGAASMCMFGLAFLIGMLDESGAL